MPEVTRYRLAVNLTDLDRLSALTRRKLFAGRLDLDAPAVRLKGGAVALPFLCDLLTAALIIDVARVAQDRDKAPIRAYLRLDNGPWRQLPASAVLTKIGTQGCRLNYDLFPVLAKKAADVPLPMEGP
jgi:hypothetical protein